MLATLIHFKSIDDKFRRDFAYVIAKIITPREFYERSILFTSDYHSPHGTAQPLTCLHISTLLYCVWKLGILGRDKRYFWKLLQSSIFKNRRNLSLTITLMVYGFHFHRLIKPG